MTMQVLESNQLKCTMILRTHFDIVMTWNKSLSPSTSDKEKNISFDNGIMGVFSQERGNIKNTNRT